MSQTGKVYLVGAGPGDPGLLTLKGQACLQQADLVLYDGLVNPLLLRHSSAHAERTCRSESPSGRVLNQQEINEQLITAAKQGKTVVRLKGGDPFIFGRGSEEAVALSEAGIPFEVVPGITAATAAGEYAGISLTHRQYASAVAFVTGHEDPSKPATMLDYDALASFPGTLVFYMGLHRVRAIAAALIESGKGPQTPAAVISQASRPSQRTVTAALKDLADAVASADLHAPSLIIVGECVSLRERAAWFEQRPLLGRRIGITRPIDQADAVIDQVVELGAEPIVMPMIEIRPPDDWQPIDAALSRLESVDWLVFTSVNGVTALLDRLWATGGDLRKLSSLRIAAIGSATAQALAEYHLKADLVPTLFRAEELAEALKPHVAGKHVLWAGADRGRDVLLNELAAANATVEKVATYRNLDVTELAPPILQRLELGEIDWVGLSSPSIARNFDRLLTETARKRIGTEIKLASISPVTSGTMRELGLTVSAEATVYTWSGILDAILEEESKPE